MSNSWRIQQSFIFVFLIIENREMKLKKIIEILTPKYIDSKNLYGIVKIIRR